MMLPRGVISFPSSRLHTPLLILMGTDLCTVIWPSQCHNFLIFLKLLFHHQRQVKNPVQRQEIHPCLQELQFDGQLHYQNQQSRSVSALNNHSQKPLFLPSDLEAKFIASLRAKASAVRLETVLCFLVRPETTVPSLFRTIIPEHAVPVGSWKLASTLHFSTSSRGGLQLQGSCLLLGTLLP